MDRENILNQNRRAYDAMAAADQPLCRPAKDSELADPLGTVDAAGWLGGKIRGKSVLALAAGGGRQSSLYAAAGANVTVVDLSPAMLELDRRVARQRQFSVRLFESSMDDLSMLRDGEFDIVIHPVSTCYVPDVRPVFAEVARVLRAGGVYVSQHKTPASLQCSVDPIPGASPSALGRSRSLEGAGDSRRGVVGNGYELNHAYYRDSPIPPLASDSTAARRLREPNATEFLHRWEQIVGGICRSGMVIEDLVEPVHAKRETAPGSFGHRASFIAPYVRIKARRVGLDQLTSPKIVF